MYDIMITQTIVWTGEAYSEGEARLKVENLTGLAMLPPHIKVEILDNGKPVDVDKFMGVEA